MIIGRKRIGFQSDPSSRGVGVVLIADVPFLQPTHNKQDFIDSDDFRLLISSMANRLKEYWTEKIVKRGIQLTAFWRELEDQKGEPPFWYQCNDCLQWRKLDHEIEGNFDEISCESMGISCTDPEHQLELSKSLKKMMQEKIVENAIPDEVTTVEIDGKTVEISSAPEPVRPCLLYTSPSPRDA
eukprot:TRINITY_DN5804_c0_g1_i1.p1 TRINITY_DN5804_c0_g1~~TRINITY_DN5804_c0_g1_i1.p1  ORF type:complete len:192 (-),score=24.11 TRINITY_DN5804_c0_g1_i1:4-555(-)